MWIWTIIRLAKGRPGAIVATVVGLVGAAFTFGMAPPALRFGHREENPGASKVVVRSACERIGAQGIPCSGAGLLVALEADNRENIDLFLAAHIGPDTVVPRENDYAQPIWQMAYERQAPGLDYLLDKSPNAKLTLVAGGCPYKDSKTGQQLYDCGPTYSVVHDGRTDEIACRLVKRDRAQAGYLEQLRSTLLKRRPTYEKYWAEYAAPASCGPTSISVQYRSSQKMNCFIEMQGGGSRDECEARQCAQGRREFLNSYPTAEAYAREETSGDEAFKFAEVLAECLPRESAKILELK